MPLSPEQNVMFILIQMFLFNPLPADRDNGRF